MKIPLKDLTADEVIKRLRAGEVIKGDKSDISYKMINDILCEIREDGRIFYNVGFYSNEEFYFEVPNKIELNVGATYKTRDGRKAFISFYYPYSAYPYKGIIEGESCAVTWDCNGLYDLKESPKDIVGKWSDEEKEKD